MRYTAEDIELRAVRRAEGPHALRDVLSMVPAQARSWAGGAR
jgi:hypothetical protein